MKRLAIVILIIVLMSSNAFAEQKKDEVNFDKINSIKSLILEKYYGQITEEELNKAAIDGMFSILDNKSHYYSAEEKKAISYLPQNYNGVGMIMKLIDGDFVISEVLSAYPAEKAGIKKNDIILSVDGVKIQNQSLLQVAELIKSETQQEVDITVLRDDAEIELKIVKKEIKAKKQGVELVQNINKSIQYIKIASFNTGVAKKFETILEACKLLGIKGIIIDLRDNSGGVFSEVVNICRLLVPEGYIVHTKDKNGNVASYSSTLKEVEFNIAVLVNDKSASCSEIFASAIKESQGGVVIGNVTYGKGSIQTVLKDELGNYVKLTTHEYLTRDGNKINSIGVKPDILIDIAEDDYKNFELTYSKDIYLDKGISSLMESFKK